MAFLEKAPKTIFYWGLFSFLVFAELFLKALFAELFSKSSLRLRGRRRRLDIVVVEVLLEVEVRELNTLRDGEKLLERRVGLDGVLVLEVVLLDIDIHGLRDLRARHERASRLREELAELIRDLDGALEDRGDAGLRLSALLNLDAALALTGILDLAVDAAVKALDLAEKRGRRLTERRERGRKNLEVLLKRREGRGRRRGGNLLDRRRGNNDRRRGGLGGLRGLRGLGGGRLNRGGDSRNYNLRLLGDLLSRGGRLGGGSRAHYTGG